MSEVKSNNFNDIVRPTLVLMIIALVTALFLALTNAGTKEVIAANAEKALLHSRQEILADAASFSEDKTGDLNGKAFTYIEGLDGSGNVIGYIFQNSTPGYGGPVTALVGIDKEGVIQGVKTVDLNETPNLGMRVGEPQFLDQFKGHSGEIGVSKQAASDTEILAVTGATISSSAFTNSVNEGLKQYAAVTGNAPEEVDPLTLAYPDAASFSEEKKVSADGKDYSYKEALNEGGDVIGYVIRGEADGYHAPVIVLTGFDLEGKIQGTATVDLQETPNLGSGVGEKEFMSQFVGKSSEISLGSLSDTSVEAVSHATISSQAFVDAVNQAIKVFPLVSGGAS